MIGRLCEFAARVDAAGLAPIPVTIAGMMRDPARIEGFERAGAHRGLFWVPTTTPDEVEQSMDGYAAAVAAYAR